MTRTPITLRGAEKLRTELKRLKSEDRPAVIRAIADARSHGDLSENAEYAAAREQQGFIEGRIKEIEGKLSHAQIIDPRTVDADGRIVFGATVELEDVETGDTVTYQIVGEDEADIKANKISVSSPMARALIGKHAGDTANVQAPGGRAPVRNPRRRISMKNFCRQPGRCLTGCLGRRLVGDRLHRRTHAVRRAVRPATGRQSGG